ncbi:MAG: cytoplasmic tRNA 2-thiolation protein 2 [Chaenotheca gracillima]|nr:MAG: cytoplasmic tRNA 2-thiolation protein 2 [Chaenotheca gracillima]
MKGYTKALGALALCITAVYGTESEINQFEETRQICSGMYSRSSWGGPVDPFILTNFEKQTPEGDADPIVSLIIFEWQDESFIGRKTGPDATLPEVICDNENVQAKLCNETEIGQFILSEDEDEKSRHTIVTQAIHLKDPKPINYPITRTGYYCVGTFGYSAENYKGLVEFRNAYGELPAAQIAKLPFYGGLSIVYAVIGAFWAFLYVQHRHDIHYQNRHGSNVGTKVFMVIVAILNAGRNSFSFFLLLIVCMGYGVVKDSLGRTMLYVRGLAVGHFVFGVIYAVGSLTITPDNAGPLVLLVILPLSATLTWFYLWTLNSLSHTMKDLLDRKQTVKALMYRKLWWCILISIFVIFAFFFLNSFTFAGRGDPDFVPDHWQFRWFVLDGWLNLVYLVDIAFVSYLWRPTANNRRFAMSDELAQDDEGFEIASFGGSLDEERRGSGDITPRGGEDRDVSPLPKPQTRPNEPRESLDGETIFAVGEDADKWSDDESPRNSGERTRLTGKD